MKSDCVYAFADHAICYEGKMGYPRFQNWSTFCTEFIQEFFLRNEAQHAVMCLETTTYFQGKHSVDEYIDKFKDLIDLSGYTDGVAIVVKFRWGLNPEIQDYIAQMMEGHPKDDDIEEWYSAANRCDENHTANATFHSLSRSTSYTHSPLTQICFNHTLSLSTKNCFTPLTCSPNSEDESFPSSVERETVLDVPTSFLPN